MRKWLQILFKIHSPSKDFSGDSMNMSVSDLKKILSKLPGDMPVIIPVITEEDANHILAFRHVRTAGILCDEYEREGNRRVLCLNAAADGVDISTQTERRDVVCEKVLF